MAIERSSSAQWEGDLKHGKGRVSLGSGALEGSYTWASRFDTGDGTNPEELIAAAESACFAMALSNALAKQGHTPTRISAEATVSLDSGTITKIHLVCRGTVPGIDGDTFVRFARDAKETCPVSKLLRAGAEITLDAALEG